MLSSITKITIDNTNMTGKGTAAYFKNVYNTLKNPLFGLFTPESIAYANIFQF